MKYNKIILISLLLFPLLAFGKVETIAKEGEGMQYLSFHIEPHNATLWVNDEIWELNEEGQATNLLGFGTYSYRVQAPNYHPESGKVTLDNADESKVVTVRLKPNFGWIEVAGDGPLRDASVYIDDMKLGNAPCKSDALKSGTHTVRIIKKMYETYSQTVTVNDNEITRLAPDLVSDFAEVTLKVDGHAEIWVNDEKKGEGTWTGPMRNGTYKIECKLENHETTMTSQVITADMAGQTITLPAPTPIYSSLNIESKPNGCQIYIDGKEMGKTPKFISEILVGSHGIKLTKDNYFDYAETITINKGEHKQVKAQLKDRSASKTITVNEVSFTMKLVEGGTFQMGSTPEQETEIVTWTNFAHGVTLSNYYIGETEVTQALWKAVMGTEPTQYGGWTEEHGRGDDYPAYLVSWHEAMEFIAKLNEKTGKDFRLPTEAEWEYAARGGNKSKSYKFAGGNDIDEVAWHKDTSGGMSHMVKRKAPNELGIYDMSGNVFEWCQDWCDFYTFSADPQIDPQGPQNGTNRVIRGGSWASSPKTCRASNRKEIAPERTTCDCGFRLCLPQ